jgi:SPOR domain
VSSVETPPPPEEVVAEPRCPRCGAPMTEQQEWCLNCGAAVGTRVVAAPGWRVPIAIAAALLAVAAIAVAVAIVQLADDTDQVAQEPPAEVAVVPTPTPTPPPAATPEASLTPDPTIPEPTTTATPDSTPESSGGSSTSGSGDAEWPDNETGWTVVLSSDSSESTARDKADDFAADGISGVGVLNSDDFSSLRPGFWVVFAGQYDSQSEASDALDGIDARDAYIRRIEPA